MSWVVGGSLIGQAGACARQVHVHASLSRILQDPLASDPLASSLLACFPSPCRSTTTAAAGGAAAAPAASVGLDRGGLSRRPLAAAWPGLRSNPMLKAATLLPPGAHN
jgi:hypothetical protein